MLALKSKLKMFLLLAGTFMLMNGTANCQQTPAQRYQPVQDSSFRTAPPSVHVAPQQMQRLASRQQPAASNASNGRPAGTSFTFSDGPRNGQTATPRQTSGLRRPVRPGFEQSPATFRAPAGSAIQQASFVVDQNNEPNVPEILANELNPARPAPGATTQSPPASQFPTTGSAPAVDEADHKSPADFAAQMAQADNGFPRIAPAELASQQQDISAQMAEIRRLSEAKAKQRAELAEKIAAEKLAAQTAALNVPAETAEKLNVAAEQPAAFQTAESAATEPVSMESQTANQVSASDFIGQIATTSKTTTEQAPVQDSNTAPKLVANTDAEQEPQSAVMQLTSSNESFTNQPVRDTQVRQVSSEVEDPTAKIKLAAPAIAVETYGPQSIGINKPANYKVVVRNQSSTMAERILVGINVPEWIDIENVNMTTGGKEITDGKNQARLVWSIDQIPGNASQTITITAVPRKAELFDVGVEWTLVPRVGKTPITVTEPKLEMTISGPAEVLYGETALYHVTARNPGTGDAENVTVMLPEALGGARATLGNIDAGKEKTFQVELLARTAGDLNLLATAVGDGNLKTTAERALTVRRAILGISLEGPGLKYAGSIAQYVVKITNTGDATASEVVTAVALPTGVKYLGGIEAVKLIEGGMRWTVGSLEPGQTREYKVNCQLDTSGDLQLEVGARGKGDLAASSACLTTVETVADLVLTVADPKGPLPTGEQVPYEIKVHNRGSKAAKGVNLVMQFSEGIEPQKASGLEHRVVPGQVLFSPIESIEPGQELTFQVTALAMKSGTHIFRAQLTCQDSDAREIAEGTTRFFGDAVQPTTTAKSRDNENDFQAGVGTEFKR